MLDLLVSCARGVEGLVENELDALGAEQCEQSPGVVRCAGTWETVWRANLALRCGRRVLVGLADWDAFDGESLRAGFLRRIGNDVGLQDLLRPDRSIAVHGTTSSSRLKDGRAVAGIVRSALHEFQKRCGNAQSSVAPNEPDLPLRIRVHRDRATLLLDTSGRPLDARGSDGERRGLPRATVCAALMAAACWDGQGALLDPYADDGRVLEEAVAVAEGWSPGARRARWPFQGLSSFDRAAFSRLERPTPAAPGVMVHAGDPSQPRVRALRGWATDLGIEKRCRSRHTHISQLSAPEATGLMISAPPPDLDAEGWAQVGEALKHRFPGWTAALLCQGGGEKHLGLRPRRALRVRDGQLDGTIVVLDLWAGRRNR